MKQTTENGTEWEIVKEDKQHYLKCKVPITATEKMQIVKRQEDIRREGIRQHREEEFHAGCL